MRIERLSEKNRHIYDKAIKLYKDSFPAEERRDDEEQNRVLKKEDYHVDFIMDDDEFFGIMFYWETESFIFLEHFSILPEFRNKGMGAKALNLLKSKGKRLILEIEPPVDSITIRRYEFYKRNGFVMTPHHHIQAKYHIGDEDLELKILSYPDALTVEQYLSFQNYMTKEIGIQPLCTDEIEVRPLKSDDDLMQAAKLIYLTDPYIYPYWFDSIEDGQKVIREMISLPTIYNMKNITVAATKDGKLAGLVVSAEKIDEKEEYLIEAFRKANVKCDERTHKIFTDYYAEMNENHEGLYIANVAVDSMFRKKGIAATMLLSIIKNRGFCHLECVKANVGAVRLYQRLGFAIKNEYPGVFDVPCYNMVYNE